MREPCSNTLYELLYNGNQEDSTHPDTTLLIRQNLAVKALEGASGIPWNKRLEWCEGDFESLFEELQELEESDKIIEMAEELSGDAEYKTTYEIGDT